MMTSLDTPKLEHCAGDASTGPSPSHPGLGHASEGGVQRVAARHVGTSMISCHYFRFFYPGPWAYRRTRSCQGMASFFFACYDDCAPLRHRGSGVSGPESN